MSEPAMQIAPVQAVTKIRRACVFCGGPADSREHVFAKRLCARAQATMLTVVAGLYTQKDGTKQRPKHLLGAVTVRHVCRVCNNGWMNDLEAWFERRMGFLIEPDWPHLAFEFIQAVNDERRLLAQWLIKTAVTFNLAVMKGKLRVEFPQEVVANVREGVLPHYCWVDLGYSKLSTVGGANGKCFRTVNGGQYQQSQIYNGFGFRFVVQFNHLLLRTALAPGADVIYDHELSGPPWRIYPVPGRGQTAVPEYQDFMQFEHSVVLKTWEGCRGNIAKAG